MDAEMNWYCSSGVRNIVSTSGYRLRFIPAIWNSYSKSDTALKPRRTTWAFCPRTKSMSSPRKPSTLTFRYGLSTSRARCTRSSTVKKGFFVWLSAMPTTISSNKVVARLTRSWCPRVIGSNVPGYTALIIGLPHQKMKMHVPRARAPENSPAPRRLEGGVALHVYPPPRGEQPAQRSERRDLHAQPVRRRDGNDVEAGARAAGEVSRIVAHDRQAPCPP